MKYFKEGNLLYGLVYFVWRGFSRLQTLFWTGFYRFVIEEIGRDVGFGSGIYIDSPKRISFGNNCNLGNYVSIHSENNESRIIVKNNVQINEKVNIDYSGGIIIFDNVLISAGAKIFTHDHGYNPHSVPTFSKLIIEEGAWIGLNVIVLPSVKRIGRGAVIGAGSVLTKSVEDWQVVAGCPAKFIKIASA